MNKLCFPSSSLSLTDGAMTLIGGNEVQMLKQSWIFLNNRALWIDSFAQVLGKKNIIYNKINSNYFCYKFYEVHKKNPSIHLVSVPLNRFILLWKFLSSNITQKERDFRFISGCAQVAICMRKRAWETICVIFLVFVLYGTSIVTFLRTWHFFFFVFLVFCFFFFSEG